ncbi:hypothetical protein FS749_006685 [Ceratobasidium sp. UAMH 11750]|nr:hypothetical protein FS749_006685 [Ceratobasidium sp. UAMH 11750]
MATRFSSRNAPNPQSIRAATPPPPAEPISPQQQLHDNCTSVLEFMKTLDIDLGTLIHAVFYGNPVSRQSILMRDARNSLYKDNKFSEFLANVYKPPRAPAAGGNIAKTGRIILVDFTMRIAQEIYAHELEAFSQGYHANKATVADWDAISVHTADHLGSRMRESCPHLWEILVKLAGDWVPDELDLSDDPNDGNEPVDLEGIKKSIKPHPHFGTILCIASLAFRLNRRNNILQSILAVYVHAKHTNKGVHNLLHQSGITMSYNWTLDFVTDLRDAKHKEAIALAATRPFVVVHDNIRMPFPVRSDRIEHQGATDNGTAISIIILDESGRAFEDVDDWGPFMRQLKARRVNGTAPRLSWEDIMTIDRLKRVRLGYIFDALDFLCMIPGMKACKVFQSDKLKRPLGPNQLSSGKGHTTKFLMLSTVDIDESTYSGNIQIVKFVMDHLKLLEDEATRDRLALQRKIPWAGDQTTVQRSTF